jgi:hypothetical protein
MIDAAGYKYRRKYGALSIITGITGHTTMLGAYCVEPLIFRLYWDSETWFGPTPKSHPPSPDTHNPSEFSFLADELGPISSWMLMKAKSGFQFPPYVWTHGAWGVNPYKEREVTDPGFFWQLGLHRNVANIIEKSTGCIYTGTICPPNQRIASGSGVIDENL